MAHTLVVMLWSVGYSGPFYSWEFFHNFGSILCSKCVCSFICVCSCMRVCCPCIIFIVCMEFSTISARDFVQNVRVIQCVYVHHILCILYALCVHHCVSSVCIFVRAFIGWFQVDRRWSLGRQVEHGARRDEHRGIEAHGGERAAGELPGLPCGGSGQHSFRQNGGGLQVSLVYPLVGSFRTRGCLTNQPSTTRVLLAPCFVNLSVIFHEWSFLGNVTVLVATRSGWFVRG